jgi:hypothetical protein
VRYVDFRYHDNCLSPGVPFSFSNVFSVHREANMIVMEELIRGTASNAFSRYSCGYCTVNIIILPTSKRKLSLQLCHR